MQENINIPDSNITTNLSFRELVLMNMQQLTNFPYIEKDFDALTDYGLLCLVVKFLNDVIINQNEQNESITRMYESFLALQTYVNNTKDTLEVAFNNLDNYVRNYFDNLDVQEEINNKLDQMLEDGVLEQIIEQFLQSTALWCFDTIADLKLATNLANGSYVKTLGYYTINDGGECIFKIRIKNENETANEITTISLYDENLIGELSFSTKINVLQLGCKRNVDYDNTSKIQYMLTNYDNIILYFPIGVYQFNSELIVPNNITFMGDKNTRTSYTTSRNQSIMYYKASTNNKTFLTQQSSSWQLNLDNIALLSNSGEWHDKGLDDATIPYNQYEYNITYSDINGVNYYNKSSYLKNSNITGFSGYGVSLVATMKIHNCQFVNCNKCVVLTANDCMFYDCYFTESVTGIYKESGSANIFIWNCYFDLLVEHGIDVTGTLGGRINAFIDHTGYAGISAGIFNKLIAEISCYRTGMYNSGLTIEDLKSETQATERENFKKGSGLCALSYIENCNITINSFPVSNDDAFTSTKKSPVCSLYSYSTTMNPASGQNQPSVINLIDVNDCYIHDINYPIYILNNRDGFSRYSNYRKYYTPFITVQTYAPSATTKTYNLGDMWLVSSSGRLFVATAIDSGTGYATWKEVTFIS